MDSRTELLLRRLRDIQKSDGISIRHLEEVATRKVRPQVAKTSSQFDQISTAIESRIPGSEHKSFRYGDANIATTPAIRIPKRLSTFSAHQKVERSARPRITMEALKSWHRFEKNKTLTPKDVTHLESIIYNVLRPAFDVQADSYDDLPSQWSDLNAKKAAIEPIIRGIGRLNLQGHPDLTAVGTAFVCGERRVITNCHVAAYFTRGLGEGAELSFTPGISSSMDFKQEVGYPDKVVVQITAPLLLIEELDIAILQVDRLPQNVSPLPLATAPPPRAEDGMAAVIGYPAFDDNEDFADQARIFRSVFGKKRLQPGRFNGMKATTVFSHPFKALAHDCSTLGGNSGSALIDVDTGKVSGIHFGGQSAIANYAIPTWTLAGDSRVRKNGVIFSEIH